MSTVDAVSAEGQRTGGRDTGFPLKICLASTSGGHLRQLGTLRPILGNTPAYLVSVDSPDIGWVFPGLRKYRIQRILRNPSAFAVNWIQSLAILLRERPSAIITTGAGDAFPTAVIGAALGIPILFIESVARVYYPSLFGRLLQYFASVVVVQWPPLQPRLRNAVLASPSIKPPYRISAIPNTPRIVVLTGTYTRGFERLLRAIDALLEDGRLDAIVFAQIGHSTYTPVHYAFERFLPPESLAARLRSSDLVVTHDGSGSIADGLAAGKPVIVVPRSAKDGEVSYRSTSELAHHLSLLGWITLLEEPYGLPDSVHRLHIGQTSEMPSTLPEVADVVSEFLHSLTGFPGCHRDTQMPSKSTQLPHRKPEG